MTKYRFKELFIDVCRDWPNDAKYMGSKRTEHGRKYSRQFIADKFYQRIQQEENNQSQTQPQPLQTNPNNKQTSAKTGGSTVHYASSIAQAAAAVCGCQACKRGIKH